MLAKSEVKFSPQQQAFIHWAEKGHGSGILKSVAGSGKTTTIIAAVKRMPGQSAILAFNKSIAKEIKEKLEKEGIDWQKAQAGTVHSFGFSAYRKAYPRVKVDDDKVQKIIDQYQEEAESEQSKEFWHRHAGKIKALVGHAKNRALGVIGSIDDDKLWFDIIEHFDIIDDEGQIDPVEIITVAKAVLRESNLNRAAIDFSDMIYLPLLYRLRFWRYDNVWVDEAQDTNPARRLLVAVLVKKGGRVMAVGDEHQAIYAFTGADNDSLDQIQKDFSASEHRLTVSYRCPKAVVAFAQAWVSHIEASPEAPAGKVTTNNENEFFARQEEFGGDTAVLCRLTKPLVSLAFALIRRKIACKIEGRDIGNGLKKLATRWKVKNLDQLEGKLDAYLEGETTKLLAKKLEAKLTTLEDSIETLKVILDQCRIEKKFTVDELIATIDSIFEDNIKGILTLSTIHKAKGREWLKVFWLNRAGTCPSPWARQQWQKDQENNLCYVAATRAQFELCELNINLDKKKEK